MHSTPSSLYDFLQPTVEAFGFALWGIEFARQHGDLLLRVYIDKQGGVGVNDCAVVSEQVSALLDANEIFADAYTLEVSSPGLDRRFFFSEQLQAYVGRQLYIEFKSLLYKRRRLKAELRSVDGDTVSVSSGDECYQFNFNEADKIKLTFNFS